MSKLECNDENVKLCDELLSYFNNSTEFNFSAEEEFYSDNNRKNVFCIKGSFNREQKSECNIILYYS